MPLFRNLNFTLAAGEFIVIAGKSGCRKTTLLKLLLGLITATQGEVLVDGLPLLKFGLRRYKSQIAAVLHNDSLLAGSLAYNIHLERDQDNFQRLQIACTQACIHDEICSLPLEFNTQVGEMGVALSAGQIQRVLLARALYRRPKILILDESLSYLSTDVAAQVIANIRRAGTTLILVSHNAEFSALADHILDLGNEALVQSDRLGKNSTEVDEEASFGHGK